MVEFTKRFGFCIPSNKGFIMKELWEKVRLGPGRGLVSKWSDFVEEILLDVKDSPFVLSDFQRSSMNGITIHPRLMWHALNRQFWIMPVQRRRRSRSPSRRPPQVQWVPGGDSHPKGPRFPHSYEDPRVAAQPPPPSPAPVQRLCRWSRSSE